MRRKVAVVPGDGAGQEVIPEALKVIRATRADLELEEFEAGASRILRGEPALPDEVFAELGKADAILFGAVGDPRVPDVGYASSFLLRLRFELDLYANLRPAKLYDDRLSPLREEARRNLSILVARENTEGIYVGTGGRFKRGTRAEVALQEDLNTDIGVRRIIELAFTRATREVCMVDKSNVMQHAGGLWLDIWEEVKHSHPHIAARHLYVDAAAMELIRDPTRFDVIVTSNMFGDILSDITAQLTGGVGLAPSGSINPDNGRALFEPVHGSAPTIAGQGIVNPLGAILSAAMMLHHLGYRAEALAIEEAVTGAIKDLDCTRDLGGAMTTSQAGDAVVRRIN